MPLPPTAAVASHSVEMAHPWLAWRLASYAAQLCIAAGFHDETYMTKDVKETKDTKVLLFWHVYAMEKGLALRLGRSSLIRNCDITLPCDMASLALPKPWDVILPFWVWNASMHDKLYKSLYSRTAIKAPDEAVFKSADDLLAELVAVEPNEKDTNKGNLERLGNVLAASRKVLYYTTATLISRVKVIRAPNPTLPPDCVEYAKAAIHAHHDCMSMMNGHRHVMNIYLHWSIIHAPFVPVLVLFCEVVSRQDAEALQLLEHFAKSLELTTDLSPSAQEFYEMTQNLCQVAKLQMESSVETALELSLSLSTSSLSQYFAASMLSVAGDENVAIHLPSEQMELMFGGHNVMDFHNEF
nr:fungal specific transcription factor domain-containing protein [Colletotrichum truncatum]KAF6784375.1 fungal specific transcription factor domain-containing protein [Colletotrichum truncatum]